MSGAIFFLCSNKAWKGAGLLDSKKHEMSDFIPRGMRLAAEKLSVLSRNRFKLLPSGASTAAPNQIITVNMPSNVLLHASSFKMHARVTTTKSGTGDASVYGKLPQDASSLINRLEITCNGISLSQGSDQYNTVCRILKIGGSTRDRDLSIDRTLAHAAITDDANVDDETIVFSNFRGFLCDSSAAYLPTDLCGQIQVRITLAGAEVLSNRGGQSGGAIGTELTTAQKATVASSPVTYSVSDIYFTVDTVAVSPVYGEMLRSRIMDAGYIPILYREWYTYGQGSINTSSYSTRFALSSGSIDKLYAVQRLASYTDRDQVGVEMTDTVFTDNLVSDYFNFASFDSSIKVDGTLTYVWNVNNVQIPQYRAKSSDAMWDLAYGWAKQTGQSGNLCTSRKHWHENCAIFTCVLNLPEEGIALMSGYDSRGSNSQFSFDVSGLVLGGLSIHSFVIAECTQELRVGAGLSLAVSH